MALLGLTVPSYATKAPAIIGQYSAPFLLQASTGITGGFASNLLRKEPSQEAGAIGWLALTPELRLGSPTGSLIRWHANMGAQIGVPISNTPSVGETSSVHADLRMLIAPTSPVSLLLTNTTLRSPSSPDLSLVHLDPTTINRTSASLISGGKAWEFQLRYDFEVLDHQSTSGANRHQHLLSADVTYHFSSHSELWLRTSAEWIFWTEPDDLTTNMHPLPLRASVGIQGYMTRHFWGRLVGGYATILNNPQDAFNSGIGELALGWDTRFVNVSLGVERAIATAYWGQYVSQNRAFFRLECRTTPIKKPGALQLSIDTGYALLIHAQYAPPNTTIAGLTQSSNTQPISVYASHQERQGQQVYATVTADVSLTTWLALRLSYRGHGIISNFRTQRVTISESVTETTLTIWNWRTHIGEIGLRLFY